MRRNPILTHAAALLLGMTLVSTAEATPPTLTPAVIRVVSESASSVRSYRSHPISTVTLT